jgi:hypothetical protein
MYVTLKRPLLCTPKEKEPSFPKGLSGPDAWLFSATKVSLISLLVRTTGVNLTSLPSFLSMGDAFGPGRPLKQCLSFPNSSIFEARNSLIRYFKINKDLG